MQRAMLEKARAFRTRIREDGSKEEIYAYFTPKSPEKPEIHGGFVLAHWSGEAAVEEQLKDDLKVTIRCVPLDTDGDLAPEPGTCPSLANPASAVSCWEVVLRSFLCVSARVYSILKTEYSH